MSTGLVRDQFLNALDSNNREALVRLAGLLEGCRDPLPTMVCSQLGLPPGSAYAAAARELLAVTSASSQQSSS